MTGNAVRTHLLRGAALAALCAGLATPPAVLAAPADPAAEAAPIAAEISGTYGLPGPEAEALQRQVAIHLDRGGDARGVRDLAAASVDIGCREGCLDAALAAVNRAMWLGHRPEEARKLVIRALREAARSGGPGTLAERMQARMERFHRRSAGF